MALMLHLAPGFLLSLYHKAKSSSRCVADVFSSLAQKPLIFLSTKPLVLGTILRRAKLSILILFVFFINSVPTRARIDPGIELVFGSQLASLFNTQ